MELDQLIEVDVEHISVNPYQPRRHFNTEELEDLASSIKAVGLIHPPVVRPLSQDRYELVSGERRLRATQLAGFKSIRVIVQKRTHSLSAQAALIENVQRVDLNPLEIAQALKQLMLEFSFTQDDLAVQIGKKRSTIANYLRLLTLPKPIQQSISQGLITMGHAKVILSLTESDQMELLHQAILRDEMTVRQAEEFALKIVDRIKKNKLTYETRDFYLEEIAEKLQRLLGTKVVIQPMGKKGRLTIDYYNLDDLDRLLSLFGISQN